MATLFSRPQSITLKQGPLDEDMCLEGMTENFIAFFFQQNDEQNNDLTHFG